MSKTIPWGLALAAAMSFTPAHSASGPSVTLQQCANGSFSAAPRACSGSAWISGTVNKNNSHYVEDNATPLRLVFSGLQVGSTNVITFQWDTTEAGVHAYDYLESFDHTETLGMGDNPCSGVAGCSLGTFTTVAVPVDPLVSGSGVIQRAGVFVLFNGTLTGVSAYQYVGTFTGRSTATITLTFTANTSNPVLAIGGHLARQVDWGVASGASSVSGTLQTRLYSFNGKNKSQAQSLSGVAVIAGP